MTTNQKLVAGVGVYLAIGVVVAMNQPKSGTVTKPLQFLIYALLWPKVLLVKKQSESKLGTVPPTATDVANANGVVPPTTATQAAEATLANPAETAKEMVSTTAPIVPIEVAPVT